MTNPYFFPPIRKRIVRSKEKHDKALTISEKARTASYEAAYLIAKDKKNHTARGEPESGRMNLFSELNDNLEEDEFSQNIVKQSIISHLHNLPQRFDKYFPEDTAPQQHDWVLSPFTVSSTQHLSSDLTKASDDLSNNRRLKIAFDIKKKLFAKFSVSVAQEYPQL